MPLTSRQRVIRRRQRRVKKIRELKQQLEQTQDSTKRKKILEKIRKHSPWDSVLSE